MPFDTHPASLSSHVKAMHDDRNKCIGHKATSAMEEAKFFEARIRIHAFLDACETLGVLLPETCNDYRAEINAIVAKQFITDEEVDRLHAQHAKEMAQYEAMLGHERDARGAAEEAQGAAEEAQGAAEEQRDVARRSCNEVEMKRVVGERYYQKMAGYRKRRQAELLEVRGRLDRAIFCTTPTRPPHKPPSSPPFHPNTRTCFPRSLMASSLH